MRAQRTKQDWESHHVAVAAGALVVDLLDGVAAAHLHARTHHTPQLLRHLRITPLHVCRATFLKPAILTLYGALLAPVNAIASAVSSPTRFCWHMLNKHNSPDAGTTPTRADAVSNCKNTRQVL